MAIAVVLLGPILLFAGLVLAAGFALVMSLPVGLFCALLARRKGLSVRRYGFAGAAYTLLFFLPGAYFAVRLLDRQINSCLVAAAYVLLYGAWVYGDLGSAIILFLSHTAAPDITTGDEDATGPVLGVFLLALFTTIVVSGYHLFQRYDADKSRRRQGESVEVGPPQSLFLERVYLAPFAGAYVSHIVILLAFLRDRLNEGSL